MNLVFILEQRFYRTPDGSVWTPNSFPYSFWDCYLQVFDTVRVVARVRDVSSVPSEFSRGDGERVSFTAVPSYIGLGQFVSKSLTVVRTVRSAVTPADAIIMRVPSLLANLLVSRLIKGNRPYALELVGDPSDVFSPGVIRHPMRLFFRWWFTRQLKWQCWHACGVSYVTEYTLQRRYPAGPNVAWTRRVTARSEDENLDPLPSEPATFTTHYTDGVLTDEAYLASLRAPCLKRGGPVTLVTVGSLAQLYKGVDVLIDAIAMCLRDGLDLKLIVVGDGKYRSALEGRATERGLRDHVRFLGSLPAGAAVRAQLDASDLFVLASRTEGLPKALIEAMARGLPCIGTTVGGVPELLSPENLVPPNDVQALASRIKEVIGDPQRMARMSKQGFTKALEYHGNAIQERRLAFYRHVKETTERWQRASEIR